jgi:hypothetical protein
MAMVRAAVIGKDGRTTALRRTLQASPRISGDVRCLSEWFVVCSIMSDSLSFHQPLILRRTIGQIASLNSV